MWSIYHKNVLSIDKNKTESKSWRGTTKDTGEERMLHLIWIVITNLQCCEYILKCPELQNFKLWVLLYVKYISKKLWKMLGDGVTPKWLTTWKCSLSKHEFLPGTHVKKVRWSRTHADSGMGGMDTRTGQKLAGQPNWSREPYRNKRLCSSEVEENWLPNVILWPAHIHRDMACMCIQAHTHAHTNNN